MREVSSAFSLFFHAGKFVQDKIKDGKQYLKIRGDDEE